MSPGFVAICIIRSNNFSGLGVENGVSSGKSFFISALLFLLLPTSLKFQIVLGVTPPIGKCPFTWILLPLLIKKTSGQTPATVFMAVILDSSTVFFNTMALTSDLTSCKLTPQISARFSMSLILHKSYSAYFNNSRNICFWPSLQQPPIGGYNKSPVKGDWIA